MANRTNRTGPKGRKPKRAPTSKARTRKETWKPIFLAALARAGNVSEAIKAAQVTRDTVYAHRKSDERFAGGWDQALEEAMDALEAEAWRRAKDGVEMPIVIEGEVCFGAVDRDGQYVPTPPATVEGMKQAAERGVRIVPLMKKTYSDGLMTLLLRAGRPGKYRDNVIPGSGALEEGDEGIVLVHTAPPSPVPPAAAAAMKAQKAAK